MLISEILRKKGPEVTTILPGSTVSEVVTVLAEHNFGALVVSANGQDIDGIVSERDVVRALATDGTSCLTKLTSEFMTTNVITCEPSATTQQLMVDMTEGRFRHMPVTENGVLVGMISIGDVVSARVSELEDEKQHLTNYISGR